MELPAQFGKYHLLEKLAVGGMAEVFLAKAFGAAGFERLLVIKKILPHMAEDEEFITMFIDEARIASTLTHSNIIQITELGQEGGDYFIAMEFCMGKDLSRTMEKLRQQKRIMPIPLAALVASRICEGLEYAHRKKDSRGFGLNIIHRDVSPANVLVSYDGDVKVIDFGIAKAQNRMGRTTAGTLKGKFGYMSPEQVRGQGLDHRSDIFSVGILLWEMLTTERLFGAENDFGTLEKVRRAEVEPPSTYNSKIPDALEKVVLRALAREPQERYEWAGDMQEDLVRFLMHEGTLTTSKSLAAFLRELFEHELDGENEKLTVFRRRGYPWQEKEGRDKSQDKLNTAEIPAAAQEPASDSSLPHDTDKTPATEATVLRPAEEAQAATIIRSEKESASVGERGSASAETNAFVEETIIRNRTGTQPRVRPQRPSKKQPTGDPASSAHEPSQPGASEEWFDDKPAGKPNSLKVFLSVVCGLMIALVGGFFLFGPQENKPTKPKQEPLLPQKSQPQEQLALDKKEPRPPADLKVVEPTPTLAKPSDTSPQQLHQKPKQEDQPKQAETLSAAATPAPPSADVSQINKTVSLSISSEPQGANIWLQGKNQGVTPKTLGELDASKKLLVVLRKKGFRKFKKNIQVGDQTQLALHAKLKPAPRVQSKPNGKGFLVANTTPWAKVIVDGQDTGKWTPVAGKNKIALSPGTHLISFVTKDGERMDVSILVEAGKTIKVIKKFSD